VLLAPQLIIIGGGVSRKAGKFVPLLNCTWARVVPAAMHNDAGIVGAAMHACPQWTGYKRAGREPYTGPPALITHVQLAA
jgi:hypothetical protein